VHLVGLTNVVCQAGIAQCAVTATLTAPDADADVTTAATVWRDRAQAVVGQLRGHPLVGIARLAGTGPMLPPGCPSAARPPPPRWPAGSGRVPAGNGYLRLVFASEPVERLAGLRDRFAAAF
jgi:hypothetical protein